jgi:hypothetical protein
MNEPTPQEFFEICTELLAAALSMRETVQRQEDAIRYLIAELKQLKSGKT